MELIQLKSPILKSLNTFNDFIGNISGSNLINILSADFIKYKILRVERLNVKVEVLGGFLKLVFDNSAY